MHYTLQRNNNTYGGWLGSQNAGRLLYGLFSWAAPNIQFRIRTLLGHRNESNPNDLELDDSGGHAEYGDGGKRMLES